MANVLTMTAREVGDPLVVISVEGDDGPLHSIDLLGE